MNGFQPAGRFETIKKPKARNKSLNDALRNSSSGEHEIKTGGNQKRSRLKKHFKHAVQDWLDAGDEFSDDI